MIYHVWFSPYPSLLGSLFSCFVLKKTAPLFLTPGPKNIHQRRRSVRRTSLSVTKEEKRTRCVGHLRARKEFIYQMNSWAFSFISAPLSSIYLPASESQSSLSSNDAVVILHYVPPIVSQERGVNAARKLFLLFYE